MVWRVGSCGCYDQFLACRDDCRPLLLVLVLLFLGGYKGNRAVPARFGTEKPKQEHHVDFDQILSESMLRELILFYDPRNHTMYSNDFEWAGEARWPSYIFKGQKFVMRRGLAILEQAGYL